MPNPVRSDLRRQVVSRFKAELYSVLVRVLLYAEIIWGPMDFLLEAPVLRVMLSSCVDGEWPKGLAFQRRR